MYALTQITRFSAGGRH